ncbi:MAG: MFS transporter [Chitinophagales bacterium]|nr:MFS transporter [Chitinophagales bacterium]
MSLIDQYRKLERPIYYLIIAEFLLQCINATFLVLVNYYLIKLGYKDYEIAKFVSYRYISVLILGVPFGLLYKRIHLLPMIKIGALLFVANAIVIIIIAPLHSNLAMTILMFLFGVFLLMSHVVSLPFLLKITSKDNLSISLSLFFQTWGASVMTVGIVSFIYNKLLTNYNSEKTIILTIFALASIAVVLLFKIPKNIEVKAQEMEEMTDTKPSEGDTRNIFYLLLPTLIIAIGAGFSIPFFNLFFFYTYQMDSDSYSIVLGLSHLIVIIFMMFTPWIQSKLGYQKGIVGIQSLGILCLIVMVWAKEFFPISIAYILSVTFFILRQPLMNSAQPIITNYKMNVIGKKNQALIGSIEATIWSGSFWFSSIIFAELRKIDLSYATIFNITIILYIIGAMSWFFIIRKLGNNK